MRSATYAAMSTVAAREMRPANLLARVFLSPRHSGHSSPHPSPHTRRPHRTQGTSGCPSRNRMAELLGAGTAAQIAGANVVSYDRGDDRVPDPLGALQLADMVQHHGGSEHLRRGVGQPLAGNVRGAAMHRLEDGGLGADVGSGCEAQPTHQARDLVAQ